MFERAIGTEELLQRLMSHSGVDIRYRVVAEFLTILILAVICDLEGVELCMSKRWRWLGWDCC